MRVLISVVAVISSVFLTISLATTVQAHRKDDDPKVKWNRIVGFTPRVAPGVFVPPGGLFVPAALSVVGNINSVGFPWTTTKGRALVNLQDGKMKFEVEGLTISGSPPLPGGSCCIALIGTTGVVTMVKGTLVCNATGGVSAVTVDTPAVPLSAEGDAEFKGSVLDEPGFSMCGSEPDDIAFLIRIAATTGPPIVGLWIAHGTVRELKDGDSD